MAKSQFFGKNKGNSSTKGPDFPIAVLNPRAVTWTMGSMASTPLTIKTCLFFPKLGVFCKFECARKKPSIFLQNKQPLFRWGGDTQSLGPVRSFRQSEPEDVGDRSLVGGLEHVLFSNNIGDNPPH